MTKKKKIILSLALGFFLILVGSIIYSWFFETLPQTAIHLLNDAANPTSTTKLLVFSPHPDDETLAAGGFIRSTRNAGGEVWIALVTDGNKHGLEQKRYEEFKQAARTLGVPESHLFFLGYPDGALHKENLQSVYGRFNRIVKEVSPNLIIAPHPKDDHLDHVITGKISALIAETKKIPLYQYLIHYSAFPHPKKDAAHLYLLPPIKTLSFDNEWQRFMLSQEDVNLKKEIILGYKSQIKVYTKKLLFGMVRQNELFQVNLWD